MTIKDLGIGISYRYKGFDMRNIITVTQVHILPRLITLATRLVSLIFLQYEKRGQGKKMIQKLQAGQSLLRHIGLYCTSMFQHQLIRANISYYKNINPIIRI